MILTVFHRTRYIYESPIKRSIQLLRLTPRNNSRQKVISWSLTLPNLVKAAQDCFGNISHYLIVEHDTQQIEIIAEGKIEVSAAIHNEELGSVPLDYYLNFTHLTRPDAALIAFIEQNIQGYPDQYYHDDSLLILNILQKLSAEILARVTYLSGVTDSETTAREAFAHGAGVCQDHAHIFLSCCRYLGIPARYVSGYLHTDNSEHLSSHAWTEVWINTAWYSFDISNQCAADEQHIELAYGLDYLDAAPVRGCRFGGGNEQLEVLSLVSQQQ